MMEAVNFVKPQINIDMEDKAAKLKALKLTMDKLEKSFGKGIAECIHLQRPRQISTQRHDTVICASGCKESSAEATAVIF